MTTGSKSNVSASHSQRSEGDDVRLFFPQASDTTTGPATTGSGQPPEPNAEQMYDSLFDADAEDEMMDLGVQIGRLCISERYVLALRRAGIFSTTVDQ